MARKPGKNGRSSTTVATTLMMPPEDLMKSLSKAKQNARKQMRSAGQIFSDKFARAQEEKHVDRRAANIAFNLDSLDDRTLHVTYYHLMRYLDDLGVPERATTQGEIFEAEHTGPGLKNGEDEGETNVTRIGTAARKVAETAGAN